MFELFLFYFSLFKLNWFLSDWKMADSAMQPEVAKNFDRPNQTLGQIREAIFIIVGETRY